MAIRIERAFGGGADTWLRLQAAYDLAQAMKRADAIKVVAMVYYHLALRYVRVFPGEFEIVCEGWDPEGDGDGESAEGMVVTEYVVAMGRRKRREEKPSWISWDRGR